MLVNSLTLNKKTKFTHNLKLIFIVINLIGDLQVGFIIISGLSAIVTRHY